MYFHEADLRHALHKNTLLTFLQPQQPTFSYDDAHIMSLSATLLQGTNITNAKPVAFSSRATTSFESCYPQLDLEALAIDFGLRRFGQYITSSPPATIITDHKLLVEIFTNNHKGSIRRDCIKLRHQDISYNVVWRQGSSNPSEYLSHHATSLCHLPPEIHKETSEFEKTFWFLQYA